MQAKLGDRPMRWTSELDVLLRQLRRNGLTFEEISRVIGVSRSSVAGRVNRLQKMRQRRTVRVRPKLAEAERV
jgi:hypothetical protein